jgi:hypothetical protein
MKPNKRQKISPVDISNTKNQNSMDNSSQPPTKKHSTMLSLQHMKQFNDQHLLHGGNDFEATINANNTTNENINNNDRNNIPQNNNNPNLNNKNYILDPININKLKSQISDTPPTPNISQQLSNNNNNNNNNNIITIENQDEDIDQSISSINQ